MHMKHIGEYIKNLQAHGKRCFTTAEAQDALNTTRNAVNSALHRLGRRGDVVSPARNFYLIVPPEYQILGCLPPDYFIPLLMKHWNMAYYTGLLSAAVYHGAAHQQPQVFQVMVEKQIRPINCGNVRVQFIKNKNLNRGATQTINVPTGSLVVSTPETTAMDLVMYQKQAGGLSHIATVLTELLDAIDGTRLLALAKQSITIAWVQRLGYLLTLTEPDDLEKKNGIIALLRKYIETKVPQPIPLNPNIPMTGFPRNKDWNVAINTEVESDI